MIYTFLAVATLAAFWRLHYCDFITFDDQLYVTENAHILNGITWQAIRWAFTTTYACFWHPLTMISIMLDFQLFGLNPHGYHLTNLLFHIANSLLLFFVLHRMTKAPWQSAFVAALFALHPLHVESVAWVAERKDVLSTFFWMLTMITYTYYIECPRIGTYLPVFAFFALGLMAKPMLVTLPFVLILLDYWPLQRFERKRSFRKKHAAPSKQRAGIGERVPVSIYKGEGKTSRKNVLKTMVESDRPKNNKDRWTFIGFLFFEKIPLLSLAAIFSVVTFIAEQEGGAVRSLGEISLGARITNAIVSFVIYIAKTIWPAKLAIPYPHPGLRPLWQVLGAILLLVIITITVIRTAKRLPYLAVGWLWFIGTLMPVIGIVQVGYHAMADRYTYIPLVGLFIMVAWGVPEILKNSRYRKVTLISSSALILSSLSVLTWIQVGYWQNSITLSSHTLEATTDNYYVYYWRGLEYANLGNYGRAIRDYDKAIGIKPDYVGAYIRRAVAYAELGDYTQAISDYDKAIEIDPKSAATYNNRGVAYAKLGNNTQAISDYDRAIEIDPKNADFYNDRGVAREAIGNSNQAISDYTQAVTINPGNAKTYNNRGLAHRTLGNNRQAIADFNRAIEINPKYPDAYNNRGVAYAELGDNMQAITDFDEAVEINAHDASVFYNRGASHYKLGHQSQAVEDLKAAARLGSEEAKSVLRGLGLSDEASW